MAGFAQLQSDGEIQAHLSLIAVDPACRRQGLGRQMLDLALRTAGGLRIDLLNTEDVRRLFTFRHAPLPHDRLSPLLRPSWTGSS